MVAGRVLGEYASIMSGVIGHTIPPEFLDKADPPDHTTDVAVAGQRETHMGFARTLATLLFIIALPVAIVTSNVRLLANAPVA